jgi:hypothetical protein
MTTQVCFSKRDTSYTLHVHTESDGLRYSLHVHIAGGGKEYSLHVHTAGGEKDTACTSILIAAERDTPCISCMASEGTHPARTLPLAVERNTTRTLILLAIKGGHKIVNSLTVTFNS